MNAFTLVKTLMYTRADVTKLQTATNVLNELYRLKKSRELPYLCVRRAIKMTETIVQDLKK